MAQKRRDGSRPAIGDDAVRRSTSRNRDEWFELPDRADCTTMDHKQVVAHIGDRFGLTAWWQQMVTVTCEQARKR